MSAPINPHWSPAPLIVDTTPSSSSSTLTRSPSSPSTSILPSPSTSLPVKRLRKTTSKVKLAAGDKLETGQASTAPAKTRSRPADKRANPPRPANAWICYRSARVHELKASSEYAKLPQADISKIIGQLWRSEPPEVRRQYEEMAALKKAEHKEKHPDYVFRPVRRNSTKRPAKPKAAPCPPPFISTGTVPSVLQPLPSSLPTPPTSCASSSSGSSYGGCDTTPDLSLPTPTFAPDELPIPPTLPRVAYAALPPVSGDWTPYTPVASNYVPPSPAWTSFDTASSFSYDCLAPSQLELPPVPTISPPLQHANTFLEGAYITPPPSATDFEEMWATAAAGCDFVEIPSSSFHP